MSTGFERLAVVFARVRSLGPGADRQAALDDACGADEALRARVTALLAEHDAAEREGPDAVALSVGLDARGALAAMPVPEETPPVVAGYRIVRRVGAGGMGTVWEAEQERPRRRVALKVMRPELGTREGLRRFEREADLLARLEHPGVARVFEQGVATTPTGPRPYLTMEYVEGAPLTTYVRGQDLDVRARVACLARVCEAVGHLHAKGVIHRDLKPGNILVSRDGSPKVLDFGVARPVDAVGTLATRAGAVVGTLAYMSPEQAAGAEDAADTRSDVYALGVLAYEVLSNRPPYDLAHRNLASAIRAIQEEEPRPLGRLDARLRGDVAAIVAKALDKEPARRYASAGELAADLRRHLADEPIVASRVAPIHQLRKFVRRHRTFVAAAAATVLALVAGLAASLHFMRVAEDEAEAARAASRLARLQAAAAALAGHETAVLREHLDSIPASRRGWAWRYLDAQADQSVVRAALPMRPRCADLAPGGAMLIASSTEARGRPGPGASWSEPTALPHSSRTYAAIVGARRLVWTKGMTFDVLDLATGEVVARFERTLCRFAATSGDRQRVAMLLSQRGGTHVEVREPEGFTVVWDVPAGGANAIALDDTGRRLALLRERELVVVEQGREDRVAAFDVRLNFETLALSPGGTRLAAAGPDQTIWIADLATGEPRDAPEAVASDPTVLRFLDGDILAVGTASGVVEIRDAATGRRRALLQGHTTPILAMASQGRLLQTVAADGTRTWILEGGPPTELAVHGSQQHSAYPPFVYFARPTPDGGRVVSGGWDGYVRVTDLATGDPLARYETSIVKHMAVSGDGRFACGGDRELAAFDPATGSSLGTVAMGDHGCVASNRDGSLLAFGTRDGSVLVVDRVTGAERRTSSPEREREIAAVTFDEADRLIAVALSRDVAYVVDARDGRVIRSFAHGSVLLHSVAIDRAGRRLAVGAAGGAAHVWDIETGARVALLTGNGRDAYAVAFGASGREVFVGSSDGIVRVFEIETGALLLRLRGHRDYVKDVALTPDGRTLLSGSGDGTIRAWSTVSMPERFEDLQAIQAAKARMAPWVADRLGEGSSPAALLAELEARPGLEPTMRRAVIDLLLEARAP